MNKGMEKGKRVTSKIGVFVISGQDQGIDNRSKRMVGPDAEGP